MGASTADGKGSALKKKVSKDRKRNEAKEQRKPKNDSKSGRGKTGKGEKLKKKGKKQGTGNKNKYAEHAALRAAKRAGELAPTGGIQKPRFNKKKSYKQEAREAKKAAKKAAIEHRMAQELASGIAHLGAAEQAEWLWGHYAQHTGASFLERGPLTVDSVAKLPEGESIEERLKQLEPEWESLLCSVEGAPVGSPVLLTVAGAAGTANDHLKHLVHFNRAAKAIKLFAKHFKQAQQEELLRSKPFALGCGTPHRMAQLVESGALQLGRVKWVMLDVGLDAKQQTLLDIKETRADWWQLYEHLKPLLECGQAKLVLFNGSLKRGAVAA